MSHSKRELVFRVCLFVAGMINFFPVLLAFIPDKIGASYGIDVLDSNYELLLRHRAILFGIVGGLMIYSAIRKKHYNLSVVMGTGEHDLFYCSSTIGQRPN